MNLSFTISKTDPSQHSLNKSNQNHPSGLKRAKALEICSGTCNNPSYKTRQKEETLNQYIKIELNLPIISVTREQSSQRQSGQSVWNIRVPVHLHTSGLYNSIDLWTRQGHVSRSRCQPVERASVPTPLITASQTARVPGKLTLSCCWGKSQIKNTKKKAYLQLWLTAYLFFHEASSRMSLRRKLPLQQDL